MRADSNPASAPVAEAGEGEGVLDHPESHLELSRVRLAKGEGGKVLLSGVATSTAEVALKNATVECHLSKGDKDAGTVSGVVQRKIPVGGTINLVAIELGDAKGVWNHHVCKITGAEAARTD
jgi:hypothetical protein